MALSTVSPGDVIQSAWGNTLVNTLKGVVGETLTVFYKGSDIASAGALTIPNSGNYFHVTGTTNITSLSTLPAGTTIKLEFDGALTVVHNATSLILSGGASYLTTSGDVFEFISDGSGNWRETSRSLSAITTSVGSSFGSTPSLTFGTGNSAGTGTGFIRRNATLALFDTTLARTLAFGDVGTTGTVGSAGGGGGFVAARDHGHPMPGTAIVPSTGNVLSVASTNGNLQWLTPAGTGAMVRLAQTVAGGASGTISFTSISGSYTNLYITGSIRSDKAANATESCTIRLNNSSSAVYDYSIIKFNNATGNTETFADTGFTFPAIPAATATAGNATQFEMWVNDYAGTTFNKGVHYLNHVEYGVSASNFEGRAFAGTFKSTAAVTQVDFILGSGNFVSGSTITIWGIL